ncbi:hypothetical protein SUGI_0319080 [Cryptomeria japonica]|nr:hypothetical protein SUGI_0319080 [Cryptomeria japonica]
MEAPKTCNPKCSRWTIPIAVSFLLLSQIWIIQNTFQCTVMENYASLRNTNLTNWKFVQHLTDSMQPQTQNDQINDLKKEMKVMGDHLRQSVEFFPLKNPNVNPKTEPDRTWFMSTLRGKEENGDPEHFYFPSEASNGRVLCINGTDMSASYGFAWPKYLPMNSTLLPGLTFIADSNWDYNNPWHSMMNLVAHEAWRIENQCRTAKRFVLYQQGHLVKKMGSWVSNFMEAVLKHQVKPDELEYGGGIVCFEEAVIYRRSLGHMSLEKRLAMFDMIRCKTRKFCHVSEVQRIVDGIRTINLTLLARTGPRSFKNESMVASVIAEECSKVAGCKFRLLHIDNLSFCQQVEVLSMTDILVTVHGAQLTNMMFMSNGSSVMEMFPKGWLERAGVGQYIYHWLASWTGMIHEGTYRDTEGPHCPTPKDPDQCFTFYKDMKVGYNQTYLAHWTSNVLARFQNIASSKEELHPSMCTCD